MQCQLAGPRALIGSIIKGKCLWWTGAESSTKLARRGRRFDEPGRIARPSARKASGTLFRIYTLGAAEPPVATRRRLASPSLAVCPATAGAKIVCHGRPITCQMAERLVPRSVPDHPGPDWRTQTTAPGTMLTIDAATGPAWMSVEEVSPAAGHWGHKPRASDHRRTRRWRGFGRRNRLRNRRAKHIVPQS